MNYTGQFLQSTPALNGTDFEKAILLIIEDNEKGSTGFITEAAIKLFIGYCGWDLGHLNDEIEEGS